MLLDNDEMIAKQKRRTWLVWDDNNSDNNNNNNNNKYNYNVYKQEPPTQRFSLRRIYKLCALSEQKERNHKTHCIFRNVIKAPSSIMYD